MLTELPYFQTAQRILEEVDDDYGLPTARYRTPSEYRDNDLVMDMDGAVWACDRTRDVWFAQGALEERTATAKPIVADVFFDPWANTGNVREPPIELDSDGKWIA